jgi:hypothetical protein
MAFAITGAATAPNCAPDTAVQQVFIVISCLLKMNLIDGNSVTTSCLARANLI